MKKTILIRTLGQIMIGAAISAISVSAFAGKTLDRVEKTKQLVVTVSAKWPPHAFLNDKHQLVGFDIDVAKDIAKRMGVKIKRSEARRGGKECVSTCRSGWSPYHKKKKTN